MWFCGNAPGGGATVRRGQPLATNADDKAINAIIPFEQFGRLTAVLPDNTVDGFWVAKRVVPRDDAIAVQVLMPPPWFSLRRSLRSDGRND